MKKQKKKQTPTHPHSNITHTPFIHMNENSEKNIFNLFFHVDVVKEKEN